MPPAPIFISYRRDDAAGYARAVCDALVREFDPESVFIDVDDIAAGQPFSEVIERAVGGSEVLLVLIGRRWLGERDGLPPRISEPGDFVRMEVAAGLAKGMRVIPLLLDGATLPAAAQLPDELRPLTERNALEIGNTRFAADMERLIRALSEGGDGPAAAPGTLGHRPVRRRLRVVASALLVVGLGAGVWQWLAAPPLGSAPASNTTPDFTRPDINGDWQAELVYDWPNARYTERFRFGGDAAELHGSASFLGVPRGLLEGQVEADALRFVTRTAELNGGETVHRYRIRLEGGEWHGVMQTEGGSSAHLPVEFIARRVAQPASVPGR
jgi:hypothetical protein